MSKKNLMTLALELFNSVPLAVGYVPKEGELNTEYGFYATPEAKYHLVSIIQYFKDNRLSGEDLNKTFHKSWKKVQTSTRYELLLEQIKHYASTYGTGHTGEIYLPDEVLDIEGLSLPIIVVGALSEEDLKEKALTMLNSGMALKQETIEDLLQLLSLLGHRFTSLNEVKNKEAKILISDWYGIYPTDPVEVLRYALYKATDSSLLIKNKETIEAIKASEYDPTVLFTSVGLSVMAEVFNRFKPLFLAFKGKNKAMINKIAKLSKKHHKPLVQNPLNLVTSMQLKKEDLHWLDNATPFAIFKAMNALRLRIGSSEDYIYRVRNGKAFIKENAPDQGKKGMWISNHAILEEHLQNDYSLKGKTLFIPEYVEYALPTSEKQYVGNIPEGTTFNGDTLAAGIYWENSWGARDLDLSAISANGKIGWNASYHNGGMTYSGDETSAPEGAVEYMLAGKQIEESLLLNNVFSGNHDCEFKIIVGTGDNINYDYMMNPENLLCEVKVQSVEKQMIIGMMSTSSCGKQLFSITNMSSGSARVSGSSKTSQIATQALADSLATRLRLDTLVLGLGANIVRSEEELPEDGINLSPLSLEKDTFVRLFEKSSK